MDIAGSKEAILKYEQPWNTPQRNTQVITLGQSTGLNIELKPGQTVVIELVATRGVSKMYYDYSALLNGVAALNYNPTHNSRDFYGVNVPQLISRNKIPNNHHAFQEIEIISFAKARINVKDQLSDEVIIVLNTEELTFGES